MVTIADRDQDTGRHAALSIATDGGRDHILGRDLGIGIRGYNQMIICPLEVGKALLTAGFKIFAQNSYATHLMRDANANGRQDE